MRIRVRIVNSLYEYSLFVVILRIYSLLGMSNAVNVVVVKDTEVAF